jgi:hypothetical protein
MPYTEILHVITSRVKKLFSSPFRASFLAQDQSQHTRGLKIKIVCSRNSYKNYAPRSGASSGAAGSAASAAGFATGLLILFEQDLSRVSKLHVFSSA